MKKLNRILGALVVYGLISFAMAFVYLRLRGWIDSASPLRPHIYLISGPSLGLFTHLGYFLYGFLSFFTFPWLALSFLKPEKKRQFLTVFLAVWLCTGWMLAGLFL